MRVVLGHLVYGLSLRPCLLSAPYHCFKFANGDQDNVADIPVDVADELELYARLLPLICHHAGAAADDTVYVSDSSKKGFAPCATTSATLLFATPSPAVKR